MQTIQQTPRRPGTNKRKFMAGGVIIALAIVALIYNGLQMGGAYYLTLDELAAKGSSMTGQGVRLNAEVDKESVDYDARALTLSFDLVDPTTGARRAVTYNDPMPDLFMRSESVIVEGIVQPDGALDAHNIIVKCPSKYEEAADNGEITPDDHANEVLLQ